MPFAPGSLLAPRRGPRPTLTRGTVARKERWDTWEVLIVVDGKRKYVGSFDTFEAACAAREHVYRERLAGRPVPDYRMTDEQRAERARTAGQTGRRRRLAGLPPKERREPVVVPRDDAPVARCRCMLALQPGETSCGSCLPTARDLAEQRREVI